MSSRVSRSSRVFFGSSALTVSLLACGGANRSNDMKPMKGEGANGPVTYLAANGNPLDIEKIIGENDLLPVLQDGANIPQKYRSFVDAFGKIEMGCTATHIGNGLAVTAGHCFKETPYPRTNNISCGGATVEWGFRKDKAPYMTSKCVKILAAELGDDRDYAIFVVSPVPPASIEPDFRTRTVQGTKITMFGHPQTRPLEWSKVCTVEPGENGPWGADQFSHQCDTEPGNSGSSVIDDTTLKVVGIHDGGRVPWNYATYLADTPLGEFMGGPQPTPTAQPTLTPEPTLTAGPTATPVPSATPGTPQPFPTPTPTVPANPDYPDVSFGPFGPNERLTLAEFPESAGGRVTFTIRVDTESWYDEVTVMDGNGRRSYLSGRASRTFRNLRTPVKVTFASDDDVDSKSVGLSNIKFSRLRTSEAAWVE